MGNLGKKLLGMGALGAAAGAAAYYFVKKKNENPDLQEEFADFQDNLKETAASAAGVASKFKKVMEKSVDEAVSKVKEHTDDFLDDDIFEEEDFTEAVKETAEDFVEEAAEKAEDIKEEVKEKVQDAAETIKDIKDEIKEEEKENDA